MWVFLVSSFSLGSVQVQFRFSSGLLGKSLVHSSAKSGAELNFANHNELAQLTNSNTPPRVKVGSRIVGYVGRRLVPSTLVPGELNFPPT